MGDARDSPLSEEELPKVVVKAPKPTRASPPLRKRKAALSRRRENAAYSPLTSRRANPPKGFQLEEPKKGDKISLQFLAHWKCTDFRGRAEDVRRRCIQQQQAYNQAYESNFRAFTVRNKKDLYINIRTDATHCAVDLRRTLEHLQNINYLGQNTKPIIMENPLGGFCPSLEEAHSMFWSAASILERDIVILPTATQPRRIVRCGILPKIPTNVEVPIRKQHTPEPEEEEMEVEQAPMEPRIRVQYQPTIEETLRAIYAREWDQAYWSGSRSRVPRVPRDRRTRRRFFTRPEPEFRVRRTVYHPFPIREMPTPNRPLRELPVRTSGRLAKGIRRTQANHTLKDLATTIVDALVQDRHMRTYRLITTVTSALLSVTLAIRAKTKTDRGLAIASIIANFFTVLLEIFETNLKVKVSPEVVREALEQIESMVEEKTITPSFATELSPEEYEMYDIDSVSRCEHGKYTQENLNVCVKAIPKEYADSPVFSPEHVQEKLATFRRMRQENELIGSNNPQHLENREILATFITRFESMAPRETILAPRPPTIAEVDELEWEEEFEDAVETLPEAPKRPIFVPVSSSILESSTTLTSETSSAGSSCIVKDYTVTAPSAASSTTGDSASISLESYQSSTTTSGSSADIIDYTENTIKTVEETPYSSLDIREYAAFSNPSLFKEICQYNGEIPPVEVVKKGKRTVVKDLTTGKEVSKLEVVYPYILAKLVDEEHPDLDDLLQDYHGGYCVFCNNIILNDPRTVVETYQGVVEEDEYGFAAPCLMGENLGMHIVSEGPVYDFISKNEQLFFNTSEQILEEEEEGELTLGPKETQADSEHVDEKPLLATLKEHTEGYISSIIGAVVSAITLAIACFIPGASKKMADVNTGLAFMHNVNTKGIKTHQDLTNVIAKHIFGQVAPEDKLKNNIVAMVEELDKCMSVPLDSLLDDVTFPYKFRDTIESATQLLKDIPKGEAITSTLIASVKEARERYRDIQNALRDVNARPVPHVNMFMGLEGIGKTRASMHLSTQISNERYQNQGIYTVACTTKYPLPLTGQKVWNIQEVANSAKPAEEFFLANFNSIVSNMHTNIEGAAVENKMMSPQPTVINCDTNVTPEELEAKIPLSKGGTAGCLSRLTIWNVKPTWGPEIQRLPRNSRPFKADFSHLQFIRTIKEDNNWVEVDTPIGHENHRSLTLAQVKLYTYHQMDLHYQQYIPLKEQAHKILCDRERVYRAKQATKVSQSNKRGTDIFSVLFIGKPEQGKTFLAQELIEMLGLRWPLGKSIHTIKSLENVTVDPSTHHKPQIYFFDDCFLGGVNPEHDKKFMELYNNMPQKSMVITTTNNAPTVHSRRFKTTSITTRFGGFPSLGYYDRYNPIFYEQGCYRRVGYHGSFMHTQNGTTQEIVCSNDHAYIIENRQIRRVSSGQPLSRDDALQQITREWANRVVLEGVIPVRMHGQRIERPEDLDISLKFNTTKDLFNTTSSLSNMLLAAAVKMNTFVIKPKVLEKLACAGTTPFIYHSPIKTHEDLVNYAQFFVSKVRTYIPDFTAYIEVGDTGTMYYDGTRINMYLTKYKPNNSKLFIANHQIGSPVMPGQIHIYSDEHPESLNSYNDLIRKPGPKSYVVETYNTEDVYHGLWADEKDLVAAIKIDAAHHDLLMEFTKTKVTADYIKAKMIETLQRNEISWTTRAATMLMEHLDRIGLCILGLAAVITAVYVLYRIFRTDFDKEGYALYLHHIMTRRPVPQSLQYFDSVDEETLSQYREEAILKAQAYANRNNNDEYEDSAQTVRTVKKSIMAPKTVNDSWYTGPSSWALEVEEEEFNPAAWYKGTQMLKNPLNTNEPGYVRELETASANLIYVSGAAGSCYGLGITDKLFVAPGHIGEILEVRDDRVPGKVFTAEHIMRPENRDIAFYLVKEKQFPQFKDISHKFITSRAVPRLQNRLAIRTGVKAKQSAWSYVSGLLSFRAGNKPIDDYCLGAVKILAQFGEVECHGAEHPTDQGDCGLPYCNEEQAKYGLPSLVGIHVGAYSNESKIIYAALFREDIDYVQAYLKERQTQTPVVEKKTNPCVLETLEKTSTPKLFKVPNGNIYEEKQIPSDILPLDNKTRQVLRRFCPKHDYHLELRVVEDRKKVTYRVQPSVITSKAGFNTYVYNRQAANFPQRKSEGLSFAEATNSIIDQFKSGLGVQQPLINFETEVVELLGISDKTQIRSDVFNTYKRTKYADFLELDCEKRPIKNIDEFTPEELQECYKTTDGKPNQIAHQAKLLDEVLPKLPTSLKRIATKEYEQRVIYSHGKFLKFSDNFTILNGITPATDPLHPNCGAYQPININKSCGYMCGKIHNRNKKADYINMSPDGIRTWKEDPKTQDFVNTFEHMKELILCGKPEEAEQYCAMVFHTSKKDELLPNAKAWKGRVFENEDFMGLLLTRWVLGHFCARSVAMDIEEYHCQIGIEPMMGFDRLAQKHQAKPYHFAGDIGRHDKRCPREFFDIVEGGLANAHKKVCKQCRGKTPCGWVNALRFIFKHIANSKRVVLNTLIQTSRGMPSGSYVTGPINSEIIYLFYYICYVVLTGNISMATFEEQVIMATCGDDNLVSIDEEIKDIFNLQTCQKVMKELFGVQLDSDRKDGKLVPYNSSIDGLSFMSRFFRKMGNSVHYMGALKKESITAKLFFIKKTAESDIQYQTNFRMAIVEAAAWGREYYDKIINNILYAISEVPSYVCSYATIYMNYDEIMRSYLGYCTGKKDLISYTIIPQIATQSAIMNSICQLNVKQQRGHLHVISTDFRLTPKGLWECILRVQVHGGESGYLVSTKQGSTKAIAKELAATDMLQFLESLYDEPEGKITQGEKLTQSMLPTPTPTTSGGGGGGMLQALPQQPMTSPLTESTGEMLPAQKVDDREASTATSNGGILNQQVIPSDFSHNAITAFFSGVHPYTSTKITTKTPEGQLLLSVDINTLLEANPALNAIIGLHNYVQHDMVVKQRTVGPIGMTGEILISLVPSDAMPFIRTNTNAMAAIKRMYEYEIVGIQGNTARTTRLAKIVNSGFASARTTSNSLTTEVTLLVYLHTAISTTFAEPGDTSVINYYVEFTLGDQFDMSMPVAPLESIIATTPSTALGSTRPRQRGGELSMVFSTPTRFMVGGKTYGNLPTLTYMGNRTPLPYFFAQNGDNVTTGKPSGWNSGNTTDLVGAVMSTQPLWHSGDIPESPFDFKRLIKYQPKQEFYSKEEFIVLVFKMLVEEYGGEVYILEDVPTVPNFTIKYTNTWASTIPNLKVVAVNADTQQFSTLSLAIVTGNGTTFVTMTYLENNIKTEDKPFRYCVTKELITENPAPFLRNSGTILPVIYTDTVHVEDVLFDTSRVNATVPYYLTEVDDYDKKACASPLVGYITGRANGYYTSGLPIINVANTDTRASSIIASGGPNPIMRRNAACGFSCSNMSYSGTQNTRGFIPTTEHWQLCAKLEDYLAQNNLESATGVLELDGIPVGEVNYSYDTGLTINTDDTYVSSTPVTNVGISALRASNPESLAPTVLSFPSYYTGTTGVLKRGRRIAQAELFGAVAQAGAGLASGISAGINGYINDKRTREENEKDRALKIQLQEMVNKGQLTLAEAQARYTKEIKEMNIQAQKDLQQNSFANQEHMAKVNQELDIEKYQENLKSNRLNAGIVNAASSTGVPSASIGNSGWDTPAVRKERRQHLRQLPYDVSRPKPSATTIKGTNKVARSKIIQTLGSTYSDRGESQA
ncbi:polyprotein [Cheilomenes sexmaculata picorna-like virus 1]|nr:polyprotein [Cheilomenes sexmaculata picorna-like virus 1]